MNTFKRILCGGVLLFASCIWADNYQAERNVLDAQINQAFQAENFREALSLIDNGLTADEVNLGKDHPLILSRLKAKQAAQWQLGEKEQAEATGERISTLWQNALANASDPATLQLLGDFALSQHAAGKAIEIYKKVLAIREPAAQDAQSEGQLAETLYRLGKAMSEESYGRLNDESLGYVKRAIALVEKLQGPDHVNLIPLLHLLVYDRDQSVGVAEIGKLHQRIIRIAEGKYPAGHGAVLDAYRALANYYLENEQYDAALAITRPYLKNNDPAALASDFGLYTIRALMLTGQAREAADWFYKRMAWIVDNAPMEQYIRLFDANIRMLEKPGGREYTFTPEAWEEFADTVYARESNSARAFPYLSFYLRYTNIERFSNANLYLDNLEQIAELTSRYQSTQDPLGRESLLASLEPVAKYYPDKSEQLARYLAEDYRKKGERDKAKALLEAAEKYKKEAKAKEKLFETYTEYFRNNAE